ncbi:MAG: histidine--tRNA ligase [bacterium]|nr:histidine--tRNA ligase [bacterium]
MKPSLPRGTRDFGPAEMQKRQYILGIVRRNFELFGYQCIETPAMETLDTLTGKYGEEGDKLIFKILNSGNYFSEFKDDQQLLEEKNKGEKTFTKFISERALRYDLTVPFARFVVMNQNNLVFPFKRFQIQPVWRADRPQKGRYREFYQCDADVIGSDSLLNELDLITLMDKTFKELKIPAILKFNNRKILTALAEVIQEPSKISDITVAIDKLDKVGKDGVIKELREKGISESAITKLLPLLDFKGSNADKIKVLNELLGATEAGKKGIEELNFLLEQTKVLGLQHLEFELDITLARGLNYYTGTIFEAKAKVGTLSSSILGGGRYDDLTGNFGLPNMSGVGVSFGIDRIYDIMEELSLFPEKITKTSGTKLLFTHFDRDTQLFCLTLAKELHDHGISCEVYPELTKKLAKQFDYANKKGIPYVCTVGSDEMASGNLSLKNMEDGQQQKLTKKELIEHLRG